MDSAGTGLLARVNELQQHGLDRGWLVTQVNTAKELQKNVKLPVRSKAEMDDTLDEWCSLARYTEDDLDSEHEDSGNSPDSGFSLEDHGI